MHEKRIAVCWVGRLVHYLHSTLGLGEVDILGFSIDGMVAQEIALQASRLARRPMLVGRALAERDRVDVTINQCVVGSDTVIGVVDCWTIRDGKIAAIWVACFEPEALPDKLGIAYGLTR